MASFVFPNSPTPGQTVVNSDTNVTYMWLDDPGKWVIKVTAETPVNALPLLGGTMLGPIEFAEDQPTGTETVANILKLVDATNNTSVVAAASANAVKTAYDLAAAAVPGSGGSIVGGNLIIKQSGSGASDGRLYIKDWENNTNFTVFPTGNLETKGMITGSSTADLNFKIRAYGKGNKGIQFLSGTNSNSLTSLCLFNEAGIESYVGVDVTGNSKITGNTTVDGALYSYSNGAIQGSWDSGKFQTYGDIHMFSTGLTVQSLFVTGENSKTFNLQVGNYNAPTKAVAVTTTLVQSLLPTTIRCDEGLQFQDAAGTYRASIVGNTGDFYTGGSLFFPNTSGDTDLFVYGRSGKNLNIKFASSSTGAGATTQININNLEGTNINSGNVSFASTSIQRLQIYGGSSKYLRVTVANNAQNTSASTLFDWTTTGPINYLNQTWKNTSIAWTPTAGNTTNRYLYLGSGVGNLIFSEATSGTDSSQKVASWNGSYIQNFRPVLYNARAQYFRPYPAGTADGDQGDSIIINGLVGTSTDVNGTLFKQSCNKTGGSGDGIYYYGNASGSNTDELATKYWVTKGGYSLSDEAGGIVSYNTSPLELIYNDPKSTGNGDVRFKASNNSEAQDQYILVQGRSDKTVTPAQHGRLIIARDTAVQNVSAADRFVGFVAPKANDTGTTIELYSDVHFAQADQEVQDILMYGNYNGKIINFKLGTNTADSCVDTFQLSKYAAALFVELDMGQNKIVNLKQPTSANDAATKTYVDSHTSTSVSYTIDHVSGINVASRNGELNFNNSDPEQVTYISFAPNDDGGSPIKPIGGTDLIGVFVNDKAIIYQVTGGTSNALTVVWVKGTTTFANGNSALPHIFPSNFVQLTGKDSQTVNSTNFTVTGNIAAKGSTGSAVGIKNPDGGQWWWYVWHPDASQAG